MGSKNDGRKNNGNNNGLTTNKFFYKASTQKSDPWGSGEDDDGDESSIIPKKKSLNSQKRNTDSAGFDLDNVWSIRKNVQVSSSIKNGTALKTTGKSFYSRHGGLTGNRELNSSNNLSKKPRLDDETGQTSFESKGWRQGYSYSERFSNNNNNNNDNISSGGRADMDREFGDIIAMDDYRKKDDFESKMNRINIRLPMPGAPRIAPREMSARTKKAHKLHEAHLKASGLGQYTSSSGPYDRQIDDNDQVKWEKTDEFS